MHERCCAVVTHAVRTPIGRFLGQFKSLTAVDLGVAALRGLMQQAGLTGQEVDQVLMGCARQAGLGPNPARQVAVAAGLPHSVPAFTTNMACGSGLLTIVQAARLIAAGEAQCLVAGGMESMTRVPYLLNKARTGYRMGHDRLADAMYQDGFLCPMSGQLMGETAETLARKYAISREEQDRFAALSQNRTEAAMGAGRFQEEIVPVEVRDKRSGTRLVDRDEHPRQGVTPESLARLKPVFDSEGGTVTAGNASGITDGAAAVLVMSEEAARGRGFTPLARVEDWELAAVDPALMGIAPVPAVKRLNERLGRPLSMYDLVELNEAFAAQVLACDRELGLDPKRLNVNGGAIALGHPIGCTGARIVSTLLHELRRRQGKLGLASLCISGGLGMAVAFQVESS